MKSQSGLKEPPSITKALKTQPIEQKAPRAAPVGSSQLSVGKKK